MSAGHRTQVVIASYYTTHLSPLLSLQITGTDEPVSLCCDDSVSDDFLFTLPRPIAAGKMAVVNFDLCS